MCCRAASRRRLTMRPRSSASVRLRLPRKTAASAMCRRRKKSNSIRMQHIFICVTTTRSTARSITISPRRARFLSLPICRPTCSRVPSTSRNSASSTRACRRTSALPEPASSSQRSRCSKIAPKRFPQCCATRRITRRTPSTTRRPPSASTWSARSPHGSRRRAASLRWRSATRRRRRCSTMRSTAPTASTRGMQTRTAAPS